MRTLQSLPPSELGYLMADVMQVQEKDAYCKAIKETTGKTRLSVANTFMDMNNGFIPPSKQKKMIQEAGRRSSKGGGSSVVSGRSKSNDSRISRETRSMLRQRAKQQCGCGHNHDARGRCIPIRGEEDLIIKDRPRTIGLKPAKCDNAGDGLFVRKRGIRRSKTQEYGRSWSLP